jgi:DNA-binding LacI/PurR family transcriptional regulator
MRVTLAMIAKRMNCSIAAVSEVLNGHPHAETFRKDTRNGILEAAREMGYRRNENAEVMRTGIVKTVALISDFNHPSATDGSAGKILHGVLATASECGYSVKIYNTALLKKSFDEILRYGIQFVLCFSFFEKHQRAIGKFCQEHSLRLCYLQESCVEEFPMVYSDDRTAERELVRYFYQRGHRRFALLKPEDDVHYSVERRLGWEDGLRDCGLAPDSRFISSRHDPNDHYLDLETMLALPEAERPTAFICTDDSRAIRIQFVALRRGIKIPEECEVAGFGNQNASISYYPVSTTIQPFEKIGMAACRLVIGKQKGKTTASPLLFPVKIVHYTPTKR